MKKHLHILIFLLTSLATLPSFAQPMGEWTWMNGSSTNNVAVWGTQGVFAPGNYPPGVYEGCQMTDLQGNFWMYGGLDSTCGGQYADMWEFKPSINQWAWMHGPGVSQINPVYGVMGVPSPLNNPGSRAYGVSAWTDNNGDLWLFGGWNNGWGGIFADLWRYTIATNEWTWMKGPQGPTNNLGFYGTQGIPGPAVHPSARCETTANWVDANNCLWIFGGETFGGCYNDMWRYNISTNQWTWMHGPNTYGGAGTWGTKGVPNINNIPSGRMVYARWKDHLGNFWLFGGMDGDSLSPALYNDMWRFNPNTLMWTWMSGTNNINDPGFCFGPCITSTFNRPSGRFENRACTQRGCNSEHFEFFGGGGDLGATSNMDDLWDYSVALNAWTLMSGSPFPSVNQPSVYGTETVSAPTNHPGGRMGALAWTDPITEDFWLYGGVVIWSGANANHSNDLWRFVVDTTCPHIPQAPMAGFFITPDTGCVPLTVTFTDTSKFSSSFHWTFGDGTTDTIYSPPPHTFTTAGTDTVMLIVNGTGECTVPDTMMLTITIVPQPLVNLGNDTVFCKGLTYTLDAGNPGTSYLWSTGETTQTITVSTTGIYWVVASAGTCTATDTVIVTFIPQPIVALGNDTSLCDGQPITLDAGNASLSFLWSDGSTTQTISPTLSGTYAVTVTNGNNCTGTSTMNVTFIPYPNVNLGHDQSLCNNAALAVFGGVPATSYLWQDGSTASTFVIQTAGTYWVITANGTCISTDSIIITLNQAPQVNIGPDIRLCYGLDTALDAGNPGLTYLWSDGETSEKIKVSSSGLYWVRVSENGCFTYDSALVIIGDELILNLGVDTFLCPGDVMQITPGKQFVSYSWLPDLQISNTITVNKPGTYIVTVIDSNGCKASGSRLVQDFCPSDLYVPSAFTPNGNHMNEQFLAFGENIETFHMYVFDRWGEQIFESNDIALGWDGTYMDNPCQEGVYVYIIEYKLYDYLELKKHTRYGTVSLIR